MCIRDSSGTGRVALDQSPAYLLYQQRLQDGLRYLEPSKEQVA